MIKESLYAMGPKALLAIKGEHSIYYPQYLARIRFKFYIHYQINLDFLNLIEVWI